MINIFISAIADILRTSQFCVSHLSITVVFEVSILFSLVNLNWSVIELGTEFGELVLSGI